MRNATIAAILLVITGCAGARWTSHAAHSRPVFLELSVASNPWFTVTYEEDRTVRFSSGSDLRYAKLTPNELERLSKLLAESSLEVELSAFRSKSLTILMNDGLVVLRRGLDRWDIPSASVSNLSPRVMAVLDFSDGITQRHFGAGFATRSGNTQA